MSSLVRVLLAELDDRALDELAELLAPRLRGQLAPASPSPWLTPDEAADYLRCSGSTPRNRRQRIYDLVHAGELQPRRDGRRLLFHRSELDRYLGKHAVDADGDEA